MTLITFSTAKLSAFRIAFEAIESLVPDVSFIFSADGIIIRDIDKTGNLLVSAKFEGTMFDSYSYKSTSDKYKIGIAVDTIVKAVKTNLPYDYLTFEVRDEPGTKPSITITLVSTTRDEDKVCTIKRADTITSDDAIASMDFDVRCDMNPTILSKYIKDLNHSAEFITFEIGEKCLTLIGSIDDNTIVKHNIKYGKVVSVDGKNESIGSSKKIAIKRLLLLNKCVNLSPTMSIFFSDRNPMVVVYPMSSLGELKMVYM